MKTFKDYMGIEEAKIDTMLEVLAEIEHIQWMEWAQSLMDNENISQELRARWAKLMIPYKDLSEESKEQDRVYARKVLSIVSSIQSEGVTANQMFIQGKALKMLAKDRNDVILKLIDIYGAEFRNIINQFQDRMGRLPSPDDLIWVAGVHTGEDPRKVAHKIMKELDSI